MGTITIRWWGQACFSISDGVHTAIADPFPADFGYKPPDVPAQVVLVSHEHRDHNGVEAVQGEPTVLRGAGAHEAAGMSFLGVAGFHDDKSGGQRGPNTIFVWGMGGQQLVHLGDLGAPLTKEQLAAIGPVDVVMIPVGGYYTIDAQQAVEVVERLGAPIVLPMHYKTPALERLPIATVDDFVKAAEAKGWQVDRPKEPLFTLRPEDRPAEGHRVVVLAYE